VKPISVPGLAVALLAGTVAFVVLAQETPTPRAPFWPALKPNVDATLTEWFSDVPWHQKLGSYAANEIMVPLVFPYEVLKLDPGVKAYCDAPGGNPKNKLSEEDCMIEAGVANILGYHRVDTLYDPDAPKIKAAGECQGANLNQCTEVRLEISLFRNRASGAGVDLSPVLVGAQNKPPVYDGFVFTDGSTYGPQLLWEMSHYCDSMWKGDMQDSVCYGDYFSPFNNGFNPRGDYTTWPKSSPWSVYPMGAPPQVTNYCKPGETRCVMALARFNISRVTAPAGEAPDKLPDNLTFHRLNELVLTWTNDALVAFPKEISAAELANHFPWTGNPVTWKSFIYPLAAQNPFLGTYATTANPVEPAQRYPDCDTGLTGPIADNPAHVPDCTTAPKYVAETYVYPRSCTLDDLGNAAKGDQASADKLRQCGLNYEVHPNGWLAQWPTEPVDYRSVVKAGPFNYDSNQYGRTSFVFGGIPGMQMPVSFYKNPQSGSGLTVYEQVHNASVFSLYLPAANVADVTRAMNGRNYKDTAFYHTLFMSNHMESDPWQFADGIRGKVLWHNEYRMEPMYEARNKQDWLKDRWFNAAFRPLQNNYGQTPAPFHNNTCDGCHLRNGSGVPINTAGKLDPLMTGANGYMKDQVYIPFANAREAEKDYTFTGVIRPMKLVFFDLKPDGRPKMSRYSEPLNASETALAAAPRIITTGEFYYNNKIMNFYGDSFHVSPREGPTDYSYTWTYKDADASRLVVDPTCKQAGQDVKCRTDPEQHKPYVPQQVKLGTFVTPASCSLVPIAPLGKPWPVTCADIADAAIQKAVTYDATTSPPTSPTVGYMHLNGRRLGNLGVIEAIPNDVITNWQALQKGILGPAAGEIAWAPGTRDGVTGKVEKDCKTHSLTDCFIGRFGWLGDRGSLEDQVANAAFVEMNMTSSEGYRKLYGAGKVASPLRYMYPNCGPANKTCMDSKGNSDLSERDIERMADYGRWIGSPTRSEIQVSQPEVMEGEKVFKRLQCDTCHRIERIDILDPEKTVLTKKFRDRIRSHIGGSNKPFLSYIGTDLLMHDMGYLSQVGDSPVSIRDANGIVKAGFEAYVQKIRTPVLKGLRFNNYVTDAHRNTKNPGNDNKPGPTDPGCDFLLHDGRACSAIEAAFLHDGPAIKTLQVIENLGKLQANEVLQLRAFLYSL